ncbi:hypothetical protein B7494_g7191 [Chlorociboria aeruginascens]|nr:hypothetical protein B7494_g7191 [Chlorociboria aeruginascens]
MATKPVDPLRSACKCGFRSKCENVDSTSHPHSVMDFRSSNYNDNCILAWDNTIRSNGKGDPVDHIVELWQVNIAVYRAILVFEQWESTKLWYEKASLECNLETFQLLKVVFNAPANLCLVPEGINRKKSDFLKGERKDDKNLFITEPLNEQAMKYYRVAAENQVLTFKELQRLFLETGNLMFWAVERILRQNLQDALNKEYGEQLDETGKFKAIPIWLGTRTDIKGRSLYRYNPKNKVVEKSSENFPTMKRILSYSQAASEEEILRKQYRMETKAKELKEKEETWLLKGNSGTTTKKNAEKIVEELPPLKAKILEGLKNGPSNKTNPKTK